MKDGVVATVDDAAVLATLKRLDPESAKALRKELTAIGREGRKLAVARSPVGKTGRMKGAWATKSTFNAKKREVALTVKNWPKTDEQGKPLARYPFILEHGRKAGESKKTGRQITAMPARPLIKPIRKQLALKAATTEDRVRREALRILGS